MLGASTSALRVALCCRQKRAVPVVGQAPFTSFHRSAHALEVRMQAAGEKKKKVALCRAELKAASLVALHSGNNRFLANCTVQFCVSTRTTTEVSFSRWFPANDT